MSNLNDCYQCGGWMTSDDIQQRDFHGLCNKCLEKKSRELDAAYARNGDDTMTVPNRDYPAEYDLDADDGDELMCDSCGRWVDQSDKDALLTDDEVQCSTCYQREQNKSVDVEALQEDLRSKRSQFLGIYRNHQDMLTHLGATNEAELDRATYKATACGGWLKFIPNGVHIGTIVEGSDAEFNEILHFPLTHDEYNAAWSRIEVLADNAWHEANDDETDDTYIIDPLR